MGEQIQHKRALTIDQLKQQRQQMVVVEEYDYVENQVRDQQIDHATASALREQISYDEIVYMQNSRDRD